MDEKYRTGFLQQKADDCLGKAEIFILNEQWEEAVLSCYHAVFFILRAFLKKHNIQPEKTSDTVPFFKNRFVDTGVIPVSYYDKLVFVINAAGYGPEISQTSDAHLTKEIFDKADSFFNFLNEKL